MSANSKIEWTHHTFNPWWGCAKVSAGCANCYAEGTAHRYGMKVWGDNADRRFFTDKHWREPLVWEAAAKAAGERHRVFSASMADVFEDRDGLNLHRVRLFQTILHTPHLDWLLLTKRPENLTKMLPWCLDNIPAADRAPWPNVWLLTSVENQAAADQRIPELLKVPAVVHGLSMEPLLGPVDLKRWVHPGVRPGVDVDIDGDVWPGGREPYADRPPIDWVIVGGESGPKARPMHPDWARSLRDQCQAAAVPFFFKQWGEWAPWDFDRWQPDDFRVHRFDLPPGLDTEREVYRVGKKTAGRLLDAREWNEFPTLLDDSRGAANEREEIL